MIKQDFDNKTRKNKLVELQTDLVVCGGGLSGVCAAVTAAREGVRVVMIQDRPVLGGNASSEVRLWALGATSHMGNNNRWSREGGLIDEILVENTYRNKEGNPVLFDMVLLDFVKKESNITLLLNTAIYNTIKASENSIRAVEAFCSQTSTNYVVSGTNFCDATGDGIVAFQAGAAFRIGQEAKAEFNEQMAPEKENTDLLGHSIFFYSKDVGKPVKYVAPDIALKDIKEIPKYRSIKSKDKGCSFWWLEYGGKMDTIHDSEKVKDELWKVVYGVWDYIKNSGEFPEAETMTLEWVGTIPGKRESRRFEGHYMLNQNDVIDQVEFDDAVSFGGWAVDHHDVEGVYTTGASCTQWHGKGVYQIPYRCFISKNITNLFLAGRIISATHIAFGTTRVMTTCAHGGQVVGMAAALCKKHNASPEALKTGKLLNELKNALSRNGQGVPGVAYAGDNLLESAKIEASSELKLSEIPANGDWLHLERASAQLLPLCKGQVYVADFKVKAEGKTELLAELRVSDVKENYTPNITLETIEVKLEKGEQNVKFEFTEAIPENQYAFIILKKNELVHVQTSKQLITGVVSVFNGENKKVSNTGKQTAPENIGIHSFDFYTPLRRPEGQNMGLAIQPAIDNFYATNVINGFVRPWIQSNAWVADVNDIEPTLKFSWENNRIINTLTIFFDTDYDHAMESVQMGHHDSVMPFVVRDYEVLDADGNIIYENRGNYQTVNRIELTTPVVSKSLTMKFKQNESGCPVSVFQIIVN
ncbi:FAD-dependent oxidoreductase [Carboxylicivirga sp. RSCT41]|uniref:FAD-dependent oxidoreductase n=1 Tax=Carboxylicivirga agarovorans TaxID=3417570 RepID=UPI003D32C223